jgi:acetoacetyl-CoA synthetase
MQGHGGIVVEHLKALGLCLDLHPDDTFFFFSSTSWMAWNFLVGGLLPGATIVLYEGSPSYSHVDSPVGARRAPRSNCARHGLGVRYGVPQGGCHARLSP